MTTRIGVVGAAGRMGQMLVREIAGTSGAVIGGGTEAPGNAALGKDPGELAGCGPTNTRIGTDAAALFATCDAVIDFTIPAASLVHARLAAATGKAHVIGTTGFGPEEEKAIAEAAAHAPIVKAPNMSLAVNLLMALTERVAASLGPEYDIEIFEAHHRHKVDAPSTTSTRSMRLRARRSASARRRLAGAGSISRRAPCALAMAIRARARKARSASRSHAAARRSATTR